MRIELTSVLVDDQEKALRFYTEVIGFMKKRDDPMGEHRWLTVVSPDGAAGIELLLEPSAFPASRVYQKALFDAGIPVTSFGVADCEREHARLSERGVVFRMKPTRSGLVVIAAFEDTCGNVIGLHQVVADRS